MNMSELQKKNDQDLVKFITEKQSELQKFRFGATGSGMRDTSAQKNLRREIAQGLTELNTRNKKSA